MRTNPIGGGLDQDRAVAAAGMFQGPFGHRINSEHIIAINADAGDIVPSSAVHQWNFRLNFKGN